MTACKIHRATASQGDHQPIFTPERATPGSPLLDADLMSVWAAENGLNSVTYQELVNTRAVKEMVAGYIGVLNAELNRWETIKKWALLDHDLSIEGGELTPSLKVKRAVVAEQNNHTLNALYS